ncbi:MAG: TIGR04211 family SH3 domain-containing protein [Thermodesulfobacteriota bacterium]|nr:TIGR04211 family SH3 domain-containing protein [Thermodesulfobacteriota bacterium]
METIETRKPVLFILFVLIIQLSFPFGSAHGDTRYVSDMLILNLRDRPGKGYKVITRLYSNTPVEVLGESGRYFRVRTEDVKEGWVAKQYINSKPPKSLIFSRLEKVINRLNKKVEDLEKLNISSGNRDKIMTSKRKQERLQTENDRLKKEIESLQQKSVLPKDSVILWCFFVGACMFFVGLIVGKLTGRKKKKIFY